MADLNNPLAGMSSYFFAGDSGPMGASAQEMRRKIALAMMLKKGTAPKNLGEGLYSIGDSLSDALIGRSSVASAAEASAQADKQIEDIQRGVTPGKISSSAIPDDETKTTASAAPAVATPPGGNAPSWNSFAQEYSPGGLGLSQPQAAGLVGNLQAESTAAIKPSGIVGDQGTAFGAAQWRGPRLEALKQYAASQGVNPWTTEAQQGFMRHELMGTGNQPGRESGSYAALTQAKTPAQAASVFDERYERSSGEHRGRRIANAENIARALPNPRDDAAAILASRAPPPAGPAGPQDALLGEVTGMAGPASALSYAPTASTGRTGDVTSDMPPVTGAVGGPMGQAVGDTLQQRQEAIRPPQAATPPAGPQVAQAPGPFPPVAGNVKPIIPGGGFPQTMPQIRPAPPDPRAAIQKVPTAEEYIPKNEALPPPPTKPQGIGPEERRLQRQLYGDVDPRVKAAAEAIVTRERSNRNAAYENEAKIWDAEKAAWLDDRKLETEYKMKRPMTVLQVEEQRRKLEGEGFFALSPEEAKSLPQIPGVGYYKDRWNNLKTIHGPASTSVSVDTKGEAEESKVRGKLNAEREDITLKAADQAGASLGTLARAEALHNRIVTGTLEPGRTTIAALGRSLGVPDETLKSIGLRPEEVGSRQAFSAIVNELVVSKLGPGGFPTNNFSEGDRKFLINTAPSLGDDDESNRIKIASARLVSERNIEKADRWGDYREANPGKSYADFERVWNKEVRERNDTGELQKRAETLLESAKKPTSDQAPTRIDPKEKADAIKWIGDNPNSPKVQAIKQHYGLP